MGWASFTVVRLDDQSAQARRQAVLEENVRLALWRMDSSVAPMIGRENARPYYAYEAFYPAERAYTRMLSRIQAGDVVVPSPLLTDEHPRIRLHFQLEPDGAMTSPQVPTGNLLDLAESRYAPHERIRTAREQLGYLGAKLDRTRLLASLPQGEEQPDLTGGLLVASANDTPQQQVVPNTLGVPLNNVAQGQQLRTPQAQQVLSTIEWQARNKVAKQASKFSNPFNLPKKATKGKGAGLRVGPMQAMWQEGNLLLARRVEIGGRVRVQGCWLDWDALRKDMIDDVRELLPRAKLVPVEAGEDIRLNRRLASLPVLLVPGELAMEIAGGFSPIQISLIIAWACVLLAAVAVAVLLRGAVALSERRGAFVSAVTHELRTPLTTFRMYTEMLAGGMVTDADKRQRYLATLHTEADRLDHLVQNVLSYARLERNRAGGETQVLPLEELLGRFQERLAERAAQADMTLAIELDDAIAGLRVQADPGAVERILFNLVDNAAKYAASTDDRRIRIEAASSGGQVAIRVRDHGGGIPATSRAKLFRPFSKSSREAAESAPGVGLGLALSRRLARRMNGDLTLDESATRGACFVLTLPAAGPSSARS